MIRFVKEKEINEHHQVLCPHCKEIINLESTIQITEIPGGLSLSVKFFTSEITNAKHQIDLLHEKDIEITRNHLGVIEKIEK